MPALQFVFLTNELHVIPPATLQTGQPPSTVQITKRFFNSQIDEIKRDFDEAKALGAAPAEEWLKGLENRGKERRTDAARWERYESLGGVATMPSSENSETTYTENSRLPSPAAHATKMEPTVKVEQTTTTDTVPVYNPHVNSAPQTRLFPFPGPAHSQPINTSFRERYIPLPSLRSSTALLTSRISSNKCPSTLRLSVTERIRRLSPSPGTSTT